MKEHQKRRLKCVFCVARVVEDAAAGFEHHRAMAIDDRLKSQFGGLTGAARKPV